MSRFRYIALTLLLVLLMDPGSLLGQRRTSGQDQVTVLPKDARTIGRSDFCAHAALAYRGRAFSVQPHPEFTADEVALLLSVRRADLDPGIAQEVRANLDKPLSNRHLADRIAGFFKENVHA